MLGTYLMALFAMSFAAASAFTLFYFLNHLELPGFDAGEPAAQTKAHEKLAS